MHPLHRVAAGLEQRNACYCILHGWRELGESTDVDMAVSPDALPIITDVLEQNGWQGIQLVPYEVGAYYFVATAENNGHRDFLCIDAITDFRSNGRLHIHNRELLSNPGRYQGLRIASPETEFAYLLVKKVSKGVFPENQRSRLKNLHSVLGSRATAIAERLFGASSGKRIIDWISSSKWDELQLNVDALQRALRRTPAFLDSAHSIQYWAAEFKRLVHRLLHPTGFMVALLGPDGSGKSTLAEAIQRDLKEAFPKARRFYFRPDIFGFNPPGTDPNPHGARIRPQWQSFLKLILLLIDYLVGYYIVIRAYLVRSALVVFDRYYTDLLVDPARYRFRGPFGLARLIGLVIPRPDMFIILDSPERLLLERKKEIPADALRVLRASYRSLPQTLKNASLIDSSSSPDEVIKVAERLVCDNLHQRYVKSLQRLLGTGKSTSENRGEPANHEKHETGRAPLARLRTKQRRALILDKHAGALATQVCRALANRGYQVEIFAERGSHAFHSRFCARALRPPSWELEAIAAKLHILVEENPYDVIFVCNEEILEAVRHVVNLPAWRGLPLSEPSVLGTLLSKHATLRSVAKAGTPVPATIIPSDEGEIGEAVRELSFPLFVKGERGESCQNVRMVERQEDLLPIYRTIARREAAYGGKPALQQMIRGEAYSVGGLFHKGQALRLCAHRKLLTYPPVGGRTVKGITERPEGLLDEVSRVFAALSYTGLGHVEFIRDELDGDFKFIEINPRVWGSIGITEYAGVDLYEPYRLLASGVSPEPDLRFREGVLYHRFSAEVRFILERPLRLLGFVKDAIDPRIHSDFKWSDLGSHL
jgi:predicted ATP-grasp superfamily ATP-dependent carboligase/thymidylate kinase